jgi:hypothetical protein
MTLPGQSKVFLFLLDGFFCGTVRALRGLFSDWAFDRIVLRGDRVAALLVRINI